MSCLKTVVRVFTLVTLVICSACNEEQIDELIDDVNDVLTTYTVNFDTDGGSYIAPVKVNSGSTVDRPTDPTLTSYTFGNWYNSDKRLTIWDFNTPIVENITLYAKWYLNPQVIIFDTNGGSIIDSQMVEYNDVLLEPTNPTWDGYTFGGWYSDSNFTVLQGFVWKQI